MQGFQGGQRLSDDVQSEEALSKGMLDETTSPLTHSVIGGAFRVHGQLGNGFLESVYQEALAIELANRGLEFVREAEVRILYDGVPLKTRYRADFICAGELLLELKASSSLGRIDEAQVLHYLKATGLRVALLLNFGASSLEVRRLVLNPKGSGLSAESL